MVRFLMTLVLLFLASCSPNAWSNIFDYLSNSRDLPPFLAHVQTLAPHLQKLPMKPVLFAVCYSLVVLLMCRHRARIGTTEIFVMLMFIPATSLIIQVAAAAFVNVLREVEAPGYVLPLAVSFFTAFFFGLIIRSGLHLEDDFGVGTSLIVGGLAALLSASPILLPKLASDPQPLWYPFVGTAYGLFIAKANRSLREDELFS